MANILHRSEIAKERIGALGTHAHGVFNGPKSAETNALFVLGDVCNKLPILASGYARVAGVVVSADATVTRVFGSSASPEIASTIVEAIAVYVVNNDASVRQTKYEPVHQDEFSSTITIGDVDGGVKRVRINAEFCGSPVVWREHIYAIVIDKCDLTVVQLDGSHHCSFDNSLGRVAATSKVLAFGDQPSRDGSIVWQ